MNFSNCKLNETSEFKQFVIDIKKYLVNLPKYINCHSFGTCVTHPEISENIILIQNNNYNNVFDKLHESLAIFLILDEFSMEMQMYIYTQFTYHLLLYVKNLN